MGRLFDSRIIRSKELAKRLGTTVVTISRWEKQGLIPPPRKIGTGFSGWLESDIEEWFASKDPIELPQDESNSSRA